MKNVFKFKRLRKNFHQGGGIECYLLWTTHYHFFELLVMQKLRFDVIIINVYHYEHIIYS